MSSTSQPRRDISIKQKEYLLNSIKFNRYNEVESFIRKFNPKLNFWINYNFHNLTPLLVACQYWNYKIIKLLLDNGANPNYTSESGYNPIMVTIDNIQDSIQSNTFAHERKRFNIAKLLLDYGASPNCFGRMNSTPLTHALKIKNIELAMYLIEKGAIVNVCGEHDTVPPLFEACLLQNINLVRVLIEAGAIVNILYNNSDQPITPICVACANNSIEIVKLLLQNGSYVNQFETCYILPVLLAVLNGNLDLLKLLVRYGADLNCVTLEGLVPIVIASNCGHLEIVKYLIENGVDINIQDSKNRTPLIGVIESLHVNADLIKFLLLNGSRVDNRTMEFVDKLTDNDTYELLNNWKMSMLIYCFEKKNKLVDSESISMLSELI